ncbi:hypothetical protein [Sphingobacterium hotanense]|uniref:hypothetical protein n=1 Tax=Sphingobacterium hotanense TaxID=649196 RepID=UPI0021A3DFDE|nr:hypothetical protein [Sphingobacterium hotanense]MCT1526446.1 hypothetical protein [Sphingobacterium hotanense]
MITISIDGYSYGKVSTLALKLSYYIYGDEFYSYTISSSGGDTPIVKLASENGKVVIFIEDKVYFQRFQVKAFAHGMSEQAAWFQGWTAADEALVGTNIVTLPYSNRFAGNVYGENFYLSGKVGIGTMTPKESLSVNGNVRAKEFKVESANWPDHVFDPSYERMSLEELELFIKKHRHLPEIPSAAEIEEHGQSLGEMNKLLIKKIEELTLELIETRKMIKQQDSTIKELKITLQQ